MLRTPYAILLPLLILSVAVPARSQDPASRASSSPEYPVRFRQLAAMDLSVDLAVTSIHQDDVGFLWFGTEDGLFRADGYGVRSYRPIPFDSTSISDPWTNGFAGAGTGGFWVSTQSGGLNRYDARQDAFVRYGNVGPSRLKGVAVDADSVVWLATGMEGLVRFEATTGTSRRFGADDTRQRSDAFARGVLPSDELTAVLVDRTGALWIATMNAGICRFDRLAESCQNYRHDVADKTTIPSDKVQSLYEDDRGNVWVGTSGGAVARYDARNDSFTQFPRSGPSRATNVNALLALPGGDILIGGDEGLDRLDPETGERTTYRHSPNDRMSVAAGVVFALYLDRNGVVWVGTETGVSYFTAAPPQFEHFTHDTDNPNSLSDPEVWSVHEDEEGILWVGTTNGLNRIDRTTGAVTRYLPDASDPSQLATGLVMGINRTRDGSFWVTTRRGGLQRFDRTTGRVVARYEEIAGDPTSLHSELPWWIMEDSRGRTWITSGGMGCLHQMFSPGSFKRFCHDPDDPNTPAHDFARYIIEAHDGTLWLATWGGGLDRIDPDSLTFTHFRHDPANRNTPSSNFVITVREDSAGVLWLGTYGAGFSRFDPVKREFTHYTTHNSELPNDAVYEIQLDANGRLWLSTNGGLVRFDPSNESFRSYGDEAGVQDLEFNSGASFQAPSGEMFFGGVNGVNAFYPENVGSNQQTPRVVMTSLQAGGRDIRPGANSPIAVALPYATEIRLRPDQRDITISFAAIHYFDPEHNRYRYQLEGHDSDWRSDGSERAATYTNLKPGRHVFRVAASNSDGTWNEDALSVNVLVLPRFRETLLAKFLMLLSLAVFLSLLLRYRQNKLVLQHNLELEHVESQKLRELDRTRSLFFANVSHEFRTPLTLTLGPIDDVVAGRHGDVSAAAREQLSLARRNASRVLDLVNQILDVARMEAGRTPMRVRPLDLAAFLTEAAEVFLPVADKKAISFGIEGADRPIEVWADPVQFEKAIFNLLSNAFKFTPNGGAIRLRVAVSDGSARVEVRDNGPGIPESELPFVFDRFHQVAESSTRAQPGTGIGLALAREIVEKHGGQISVISEIGFGSTFSIVLPLGKDHFPADQIDPTPQAEVIKSHRESPILLGDGSSSVHQNDILLDTADVDSDVTTVLIVEDHPDGRAYIRFHLEPDYRVLEAADGAAGLELARSAMPDIIVSDVMMPEMDGFQLCRALKTNPDTDFIPIVLLTARAAHEDRMEGLRERADDYLTKPFDPEELRMRLGNIIRRSYRLKERYRGIAGPIETAGQTDDDAAPAARVAAKTTDAPPKPADTAAPNPPDLQSADAAFIERVNGIVDAHMTDDAFSVEFLAEEMGLSRAQIFRTTRRILDQSPSDIIRNRRLDRAALLLDNRVGNVSEVAYATGFKSLSHFSRSFSQKFGCRPSEYSSRHESTPTA